MTEEEKKEKELARHKAYREANKAAIAEQKRAYREANKAAIAEQKRAYLEANKNAKAEYDKVYREANKAAIAERKKAYREANKAAITEQKRAYREANKERYRRNRWKRKYGLTEDQVLTLYLRQGKRCAMPSCGRSVSLSFDASPADKVNIDHCHATGQVRGILCTTCNTSLGRYERIKEDAEAYLSTLTERVFFCGEESK